MTYAQAEAAFGRFKNKVRKSLGLEEGKKAIHSPEVREAFSKSDPETKMKFIGPQLDIFTSATGKKSDVLPIISTLAATLVIVTTLNHDLVPLRPLEVKGILTLFLVLIPSTLHYYIKLMEGVAKHAMEIIDSYQGSSTFEKMGPLSFLQHLGSDLPIIIVYFLYGAVALVVFRIWFG